MTATYTTETAINFLFLSEPDMIAAAMAHRSIPTAQAAPTAFAYGLHSLPPQPKRQGMQAQPPWHYLPKQQPQ